VIFTTSPTPRARAAPLSRGSSELLLLSDLPPSIFPSARDNFFFPKNTPGAQEEDPDEFINHEASTTVGKPKRRSQTRRKKKSRKSSKHFEILYN
jgi:hypothetical protein